MASMKLSQAYLNPGSPKRGKLLQNEFSESQCYPFGHKTNYLQLPRRKQKKKTHYESDIFSASKTKLCHHDEDKTPYTEDCISSTKQACNTFDEGPASICMRTNIEKQELMNPGTIIDKVVEKTICGAAKISASIIAHVTMDRNSSEFSTMSYFRVELIGEALQNHKSKLKSYSVNIRSAVKDTYNPQKCCKSEDTFEIYNLNGMHTYIIKLGSQDDLMQLTSERVSVEYNVTLKPKSP